MTLYSGFRSALGIVVGWMFTLPAGHYIVVDEVVIDRMLTGDSRKILVHITHIDLTGDTLL